MKYIIVSGLIDGGHREIIKKYTIVLLNSFCCCYCRK